VIKRLLQTTSLDYPLMRDPTRQPKCYDMTEEERLEAVAQVAELLKQRRRDKVMDEYYGA
jgi:hypothetical protein